MQSIVTITEPIVVIWTGVAMAQGANGSDGTSRLLSGGQGTKVMKDHDEGGSAWLNGPYCLYKMIMMTTTTTATRALNDHLSSQRHLAPCAHQPRNNRSGKTRDMR